jgi:hypothetical protein
MASRVPARLEERLVIQMSDKRFQLRCLYTGYAFLAVFTLGWVILAGFVPPPSPNDSPEMVADFFRTDTNKIRVGLIITLFCSAFLLPWCGAVCTQILRIEGARAPLTWAWIAASATLTVEFLYPSGWWLLAAFRPEDATRAQTFNDLAWLTFLGIVCTGIFQMIALAILTLRDRNPEPVYPRWFAYYQLWCAVSVTFTAGIFIFKDGPLAWNGILGFWVPVTFYVVWMVGTTIMTARAIRQDPGGDGEEDLRVRLAALEARVQAISSENPDGSTTTSVSI